MSRLPGGEPVTDMSATASSMEWYLAREGQQFGPITDAELAEFIKRGHLQPNDLLWREGFSEWRPAMVVFPALGQSAAQPKAGDTSPARAAPEPAAAPARNAERTRPVRNQDADKEVSGGRRFGRVLMLLLLVAALGAAGWAAAFPYRDTVMGLIGSVTSFSSSQALAIADRKSLESPPLAGFSASPEATDAKLQETALWRVIKREFPDWYAQRLNEAVTLAKAGSDEVAISQQMARKLVELRRQQVANALSATLPKLNLVASAFHTNLAKLRAQSTPRTCRRS
jgi:GYF domain 2